MYNTNQVYGAYPRLKSRLEGVIELCTIANYYQFCSDEADLADLDTANIGSIQGIGLTEKLNIAEVKWGSG